MKSPTAFTLRPARPDEIDVLVEIDEDAGSLFAGVGIDFSAITRDHPYARNERAQWLAASERGDVLLALDGGGDAVGMLVLDRLDGAPYLEQLSVRARAMRQGLGTRLLQRAVDWAAQRGSELWLTTYGHVAWNRPYYERHDFRVIPESECRPQMRACLLDQRSALPAPEYRVAMCRRLR